jgi:hypothetical protein
MNEQKMLDGLVREWESEGRWVDRGPWTRGEAKRAPRGCEFSVATTAGV